jgi:hypothetical protein
MQKKMTNARMSAAPRRDPTTIPAIEPPESPADVPVADVPVGAAEEVLEGNSGAIDVVVGRCTSVHRDSTLALMQHESVALGELEPQYEHSPWRLD